MLDTGLGFFGFRKLWVPGPYGKLGSQAPQQVRGDDVMGGGALSSAALGMAAQVIGAGAGRVFAFLHCADVS